MMPPRLRNLIGSLALILFVIVYMLLAMMLTARLLPQHPWYVQALGYLVAGLVWIVPAGALISWMGKGR